MMQEYDAIVIGGFGGRLRCKQRKGYKVAIIEEGMAGKILIFPNQLACHQIFMGAIILL